MYLKYVDFNGQVLDTDTMILMSHDEFVAGGKNLEGLQTCITPDGLPPTTKQVEEIFALGKELLDAAQEDNA